MRLGIVVNVMDSALQRTVHYMKYYRRNFSNVELATL
jgi:hypothetical protein